MASSKRFLAGVCGKYCGLCDEHVVHGCSGCACQLGLTCHGECAIFQCCVVDQGLEHCGLCEQFPCEIFRSLELLDHCESRQSALLRRRDQGTDGWLKERQQAEEPAGEGYLGR